MKTDELPHYEYFLDLIVSFAKTTTLQKSGDMFGDRLYRILYEGEADNDRTEPATISIDEQKFYEGVVHNINELSNFWDRKDMCVSYISETAPIADGKINLVRLRYHIESYLNLVYILAQRLKSVLKIAHRTYGIKNLSLERTASKMVDRTFKGIVDMRGLHIHQKTYDDPMLSNISMLGVLVQAQGEIFEGLGKSRLIELFEDYRSIWIDRIRRDTEAIQSVQELILGSLRLTLATELSRLGG